MKWLIAALVLLPLYSYGAIAPDKHGAQDNGTTGAQYVGIALSGVAQHALVVCAVSAPGSATFGANPVTDVNGNYTAALALHNNTGLGQQVGIYYFQDANPAGQRDITPRLDITNGVNKQYLAIACKSWTGAATSNALDLAPAIRDYNSTALAPQLSSTSTPAVDGELVFAVSLMNTTTETAGTNYVSPLTDSATTTLMFNQYWIQTTATATNGAFGSTDTIWSEALVSFKPAGGGGTVATPTYDNDTATYNNDVSVTISDSTSGATICYTTDGSTPAATTPGTCSTGTTYSTPVSITATGTVLKAIGTKAAMTNSSEKDGTYTLTNATPTFGTNGGSFNNDSSSTISDTTTSSVICYTTDGSSPAASSPGTCSAGSTYSGSISVTATGTILKALATRANYVNSSIASSNAFTLTVGNVTDAPGAGTYSSTQSVTLSITTTTGGSIRYTVNGSSPACPSTGTLYSGTISVATTQTVKAIGCKTNYVDSSPLSSLYTINAPAASAKHVIIMEQTR